jgi:hypothetical protein
MSSRPDITIRWKTSPQTWTPLGNRVASNVATVDLPAAITPVSSTTTCRSTSAVTVSSFLLVLLRTTPPPKRGGAHGRANPFARVQAYPWSNQVVTQKGYCLTFCGGALVSNPVTAKG